LGGKELTPGGAVPARRGAQASATQDRTDRGGRHDEPQALKLAFDAHAPPAGVVLGHAHDQRPELGPDGRASRPSLLFVGPLAANELLVPAHQGGRGHEERRPALPREHPAHRRKKQPVPATQLGAFDLPTKHAQLVTQDQHLDFGIRGDFDHPEGAADDGVEERVDHGDRMLRDHWCRSQSSFCAPQGVETRHPRRPYPRIRTGRMNAVEFLAPTGRGNHGTGEQAAMNACLTRG
jgi:hypothetical protein